MAFVISRLGETSSPERDYSSLKMKARRLTDSCNIPTKYYGFK